MRRSVIDLAAERVASYLDGTIKCLRKAGIARIDRGASTDACTLLPLLQELWTLLNRDGLPSTRKGRDEAIILSAYHLCKYHSESDFVAVLKDPQNAKTLWRHLGFLGRIKRCSDAFSIASMTLSNFESIRIIPLELPLQTLDTNNSMSDWTVQQALSSLGLAFDNRTISSMLGSKSIRTTAQLTEEYNRLKSASCEMHAEVQLILAVARHDCTHGRVFGYIGCSKRSCVLCLKFLHSYGEFSTRGCHGKLYNLWNVPSVVKLPGVDEVSRITIALRCVEEDMRRLIHGPPTKLQHAPESTVGGTFISTVVERFSSLELAEMVARRREDERRVNTGRSGASGANLQVGRNDESLSTDIIEPPEYEEQHARDIFHSTRHLEPGECDVCERTTTRCCSLCGREKLPRYAVNRVKTK